MSKTIKLVMELEYDFDDFRFMVGENFPEEQFRERVIEYANYDILEYIRGYSIDEWCRVVENE